MAALHPGDVRRETSSKPAVSWIAGHKALSGQPTSLHLPRRGTADTHHGLRGSINVQAEGSELKVLPQAWARDAWSVWV